MSVYPEGDLVFLREEQRVLYEKIRAVTAERDWLRAAIETVLADAESQHPGGWGPDVTTVEVLRKALRGDA